MWILMTKILIGVIVAIKKGIGPKGPGSM